MLYKSDSRLFCVYLRSTRGSLKPVLWPTSTQTVLVKVRMYVSIAIHRLRESSGKPTEKISCKQTNGKKRKATTTEKLNRMVLLSLCTAGNAHILEYACNLGHISLRFTNSFTFFELSDVH